MARIPSVEDLAELTLPVIGAFAPRPQVLDRWTLEHLARWADQYLHWDERGAVEVAMLAFLTKLDEADQAVWLDRGWPAVRDAVRS